MTFDNGDVRRRRIEEEVSRTLSSLDGTPSLQVPPYFTGGVLAAISDTGVPAGLLYTAFSRRLAPAILALFVLINIATVWVALSRSGAMQDREDAIESMIDRYGFRISDPYSSTSFK